MAKTVVTTDDLDGSSGAETVAFSYGGHAYEIDLNKKNRASFEKAIKPFLDAARTTSQLGRRSAGRGRTKATPHADFAAVRAWAAENGVPVSDRGRISAAVMEQYNAAQ